jgi:transposase
MGTTREDGKKRALREQGTLNPHPEKVRSELFDSEFFDARDMMQVKYEMLRAVQHDEQPASKAARQFGLSRPAFYRAKRSFEESGLAGLTARKRGPKGPRKLTAEMLQFIEKQRAGRRGISAEQIRDGLAAEFGVQVHARTVQRAVKRLEKGGFRP